MDQENSILEKIPLKVILLNFRDILGDDRSRRNMVIDHLYDNHLNESTDDLYDVVEFMNSNKEVLEQLKRQGESYDLGGNKWENYRIDINDDEYSDLKVFLSDNRKYLNDLFFYEPNFSGFDLKDANLEGAQFDGGNFDGVDLSFANLNETIIQYANIKNANLEGAKFLEANIFRTAFSGSNLKNADFSLSKLNHVNFDDSEINDAVFDGAFLSSVGFEGAELNRAFIKDATLMYVNISNAELKGTTIMGSFLNSTTVAAKSFETNSRGMKIFNSKIHNTHMSDMPVERVMGDYDIVNSSGGASLKLNFMDAVMNLIKEPFNVDRASQISRAELKHIMV